MSEVIMRDGTVSEDALIKIAPMLGKSPEALQAEVEGRLNEFTKKAEYEIVRYDSEVNPEEILKYASEAFDREALKYIQRRTFAGDLSGYKQLVNHFNKNKMSENRFVRLHKQGWKFFKKGDGQWYWTHPKYGEISNSEAGNSPLLR